MSTKAVGQKLVDLCRQGQFMDAMEALYSPDIVSVEAHAGGEMPQTMKGIDATRKKGEWWTSNHDVHRVEVKGPFPNGDQFTVLFTMDVTPKAGPMAGKRMTFDEIALYTVKNDKIVQETFFYDMGG